MLCFIFYYHQFNDTKSTKMTFQLNSNQFTFLLESNYQFNIGQRNNIFQNLYKEKRRKNNLSVRKSREKKKCQIENIKDEIKQLTEQRELLLARLNELKSNYDLLKDLYDEASKL